MYAYGGRKLEVVYFYIDCSAFFFFFLRYFDILYDLLPLRGLGIGVSPFLALLSSVKYGEINRTSTALGFPGSRRIDVLVSKRVLFFPSFHII